MAILTEEERELDPYALLNLDTTATEKDVQRAYRKLTLKWHPDKNSAPEAERMFHLISLAQNILRDVDKRKFVDTKLAQSRAAAARREVMDAKRKVKVDDLLRREEDAKKARSDALARRREKAEEEDVREAGRRLVEEARKRREAAAAAAQVQAERPKASSSKPPPISPEDLTIAITLPLDSEFTQESLEATLSAKYGKISGVILAPGKAKEGKKARGPRAIVEFAQGNWGGCWACHHDGGVPGGKAKWAGGEVPKWVGWAEEQGHSARSVGNGVADPVGGGGTFSSAPDFSSMAPGREHEDRIQREERNRQAALDAAAEASALESATLFAMRQRERERLAEQIRREEAEEY